LWKGAAAGAGVLCSLHCSSSHIARETRMPTLRLHSWSSVSHTVRGPQALCHPFATCIAKRSWCPPFCTTTCMPLPHASPNVRGPTVLPPFRLVDVQTVLQLLQPHNARHFQLLGLTVGSDESNGSDQMNRIPDPRSQIPALRLTALPL
jgi:hypothetical protein